MGLIHRALAHLQVQDCLGLIFRMILSLILSIQARQALIYHSSLTSNEMQDVKYNWHRLYQVIGYALIWVGITIFLFRYDTGGAYMFSHDFGENHQVTGVLIVIVGIVWLFLIRNRP